MTNLQRFRFLGVAMALAAMAIVFVIGTIVGYSDGYEAGLRHGQEMSQ